MNEGEYACKLQREVMTKEKIKRPNRKTRILSGAVLGAVLAALVILPLTSTEADQGKNEDQVRVESPTKQESLTVQVVGDSELRIPAQQQSENAADFSVPDNFKKCNSDSDCTVINNVSCVDCSREEAIGKDFVTVSRDRRNKHCSSSGQAPLSCEQSPSTNKAKCVQNETSRRKRCQIAP